ncbi:hypothetical protein MBRA_06253 [Methylobacterium brachiatum]|nr:hypothetical protein MBRA_06253 [Methylobacterium brachiatum]
MGGYEPGTEAEAEDIVRAAAGRGERLRLAGGGTAAGWAGPRRTARRSPRKNSPA